MPCKKLSSHLVALIAFAIFIAVFYLAYFLIPSTTEQSTQLSQTAVLPTEESEVIPSSTISESKLKTKIIKPVLIEDTTATENTNSVIPSSTTTTAVTNQITLTTTIDSIPFVFQVLDTTINSEIKAGTNVIDAMKKLQAENKITFSGKEFSNLGFFVNTINGQSEDTTKGLYWFLYINNLSANIGASQYIIKPDDKIEWRLKKSNL